MSDHLTHVTHIPGPPPDDEPFVCDDCRITEAEANGHFMAARSEGRHLCFLDSLPEAERDTLVKAAMALGDYLEACINAYEDGHPEVFISYGLLHEALRYLYWTTERDMLACADEEDDEEDTP